MENALLEIAVILLLLIANGVFAMAELAIVSSRKARLQEDVDEGRPGAAAALKLANSPNDFLSTVQIGISLIGILAGAFGGATIAEELEAFLDGFPALARYSELISVGVVVAVITYFSLVIGELVPKRLALRDPERVAAAVAAPMRTLTALVAPVVRVLSFSTDLVLRLLGIRPSTEPPVTEEEIKLMIEQGRQAGVFAEAEQDMIEGVLRLGDRRVEVLMTPRAQIVYFTTADSDEEVLAKLADNRFSRYPLVEGDLDRVIGIVHTKDLLVTLMAGGEVDLAAIAHKALYILEKLPALRLLTLFKEHREHTALVEDEYGVLQGLVTHNDILEDIVGFTPTLGPFARPELVKRPDGSFLVDGLMPIDELWDRLGVRSPVDPTRAGYHTLGGFVITHMGAIPNAGDSFEWAGYEFEVVDMDLNRVDKVMIRPS